MDFNRMINRIRALLMQPKAEWPLIAEEPTTVADLYKNYIIWLAAIPALVGFIKGSLINYRMLGFAGMSPAGSVGIMGAVVGYLLALVLVYVMALIIDALAPTFQGQKNRVQALKTIAYALTAAWIASIANLLPWLGPLIALAGILYSIYLLYIALPHTMHCPPEKTVTYTIVIIVITFLLGLTLDAVIGARVSMP